MCLCRVVIIVPSTCRRLFTVLPPMAEDEEGRERRRGSLKSCIRKPTSGKRAKRVRFRY